MPEHYYAEKPTSVGRKEIISDVVRGVAVEFIVEPGVFSRRRIDPGTKLLLESAIIPEEGNVLDVGAGYGVIGITIAKLNPKLKVYMVDINKRAVKLCKINAKLNRVEDRTFIFHGNLYEPLPKNLRFNMIISNPPYSAGFNIVEKLVRDAKTWLKEKGTLQLVVRKGDKKLRKIMKETFGNVKVLASKSGYKVLLSVKST